MPSCRPSAAEMGHRHPLRAISRYVMQTPGAGHAAVSFTSGHGIVSDVVRDVATMLVRDGLSPTAVDDATIALAEALNNIEEHAYDGERGLPVLIDIRLNAGSARFRIEDRGRPLPRESLPKDRMPTTDPAALEQWPEGGFGWAILHRVTRDLTYCRSGAWNRLCFTIS